MSENIQKIEIEDVIKEEFIPYAGQSLINFLPSIDGCLPVHRKIGISMLRNGRLPNNPFVKSVKAMGEIVTYYIYGTSGLYQAMVNMANNNMNIPMLISKGSWGDKRRKDGYASAERYTDCKLSEYMVDMMKGLKTKPFNENIVPMKPNFDNTTDEMLVMPSLPPNILLNMSQSISLSEASKIPPFNVAETCDSIKYYIKNEDMEKAMDIIKCPDFNFGGQIIFDKEVFRNIYKTGRGTFTLLGKYKYNKERNMITIYEIPFNTTIDDIEIGIRNNYEKDNFKEIVDVHNGCGKDGIGLDIYLKKNSDIDLFISKLRKYTPFESKFSCNFTILDIDWKTPKLMSLQDIYDKWIIHRINCIKCEYKFDIDKSNNELHLLYGLKILLTDLDLAIQLIRQSKNETEAINGIKNHFDITDKQAEYIAGIRLVNINKDWIQKKISNIDELENKVKEYETIINSDEKIKDIICEQLEYCKKKYGMPRRTEIIYEDKIQEISKDIYIDDFNCKVILTKEQYIKKNLRYLEAQKLKENDEILQVLDTNNKDTILLFTNQGNVYLKKIHEIQECTPSALGSYLPSILSNLEDAEKVIKGVVTSDFSGYMIIVFANGKIAKVSMKSYQSNRSKLTKAYNTDSELVNMFAIKDDVELIMKSNLDKVLITNTSIVNSKDSKSTQGVQVMKSKKDSVVTMCELISDIDVECIEDLDYYCNESGKGIGVFKKKSDEIKLK